MELIERKKIKENFVLFSPVEIDLVMQITAMNIKSMKKGF